MLVLKKISELRRWRQKISRAIRLGFVPTMGDLHAGHCALISRSIKENDLTIVSIFVNPNQFNDPADYKSYRRDTRADIRLAKNLGVDLLFIPSASEIYPAGFQTLVQVRDCSKNLCGKFRPGHFEAVATIVLKLFNLVQPQSAYFGLKDFQQCRVIEQMVEDLNLPVKIVLCPTVRDADSLPYSSRNRKLSLAERERATRIYPALQALSDLLQYGEVFSRKSLMNHFLKKLKLNKMDRVEYLEIADPVTLVPVKGRPFVPKGTVPFLKKDKERDGSPLVSLRETSTAPNTMGLPVAFSAVKSVRFPLLIACAVRIGKTRLIDHLLIPKEC